MLRFRLQPIPCKIVILECSVGNGTPWERVLVANLARKQVKVDIGQRCFFCGCTSNVPRFAQGQPKLYVSKWKNFIEQLAILYSNSTQLLPGWMGDEATRETWMVTLDNWQCGAYTQLSKSWRFCNFVALPMGGGFLVSRCICGV